MSQRESRLSSRTIRRAAMFSAAVATMSLCGIAHSQTVWIGPAGVPADYGNGANWTAGVPGGVGFINNGGIAQITTDQPEALALQLGSDAGFTGSILHDSGS